MCHHPTNIVFSEQTLCLACLSLMLICSISRKTSLPRYQNKLHRLMNNVSISGNYSVKGFKSRQLNTCVYVYLCGCACALQYQTLLAGGGCVLGLSATHILGVLPRAHANHVAQHRIHVQLFPTHASANLSLELNTYLSKNMC